MFGMMFAVTQRHSDEPVVEEYPKCPRCEDDWHGLPKSDCKGSWQSEGA